jgi:hypothetical protein
MLRAYSSRPGTGTGTGMNKSREIDERLVES